MSQLLEDVFRFCPVCGERANDTGEIPFVCDACGYHHYFSPATAVGALIADQSGRLLFIERAKNPGKGRLGIPGGFVDIGETAEDAVKREVLEEVGLSTEEVYFLMTAPNVYHYKGIETQVIDLFFVCLVTSFEQLNLQEQEVSDYQFEIPREEIYDKMAFESNRLAVKKYAELYLGNSS